MLEVSALVSKEVSWAVISPRFETMGFMPLKLSPSLKREKRRKTRETRQYHKMAKKTKVWLRIKCLWLPYTVPKKSRNLHHYLRLKMCHYKPLITQNILWIWWILYTITTGGNSNSTAFNTRKPGSVLEKTFTQGHITSNGIWRPSLGFWPQPLSHSPLFYRLHSRRMQCTGRTWSHNS